MSILDARGNLPENGASRMRAMVTLTVILTASCGRLSFDPLGDGELSDAEVPLADVVPLAPCEPHEYGIGGVNPRDVPPIAWHDDLLIVGFHANGFGIRLYRDGTHIGTTELTPQITDPVGGAFEVTASGYLAAWTEQQNVRVRPMDRQANPTAPAASVGTGTFARLAQNGGEAMLVWRNGTALAFRRFDFDGTALASEQPLEVGIPVNGGFRITGHGAGLAVVAKEGNTTNAVLARVSPTGAVTQAIPFQVTTAQVTNIEVVSIGNTNVVAWAAGTDVWFATIHADGTIEPAFPAVSFPLASTVTIGLAWTRERFALASTRVEPTAIRTALHWLDVAGTPIGAVDELESFPWSTSAETRLPTVIAAPGRAAFTMALRSEPDDAIQQVAYQRCY